MDYLPPVPVPTQEGNPWTNVASSYEQSAGSAANTAATRIPEMQANVQNMQSQYPTFPNQFGIGSQQPFSLGASPPTTQPAPTSPSTPDAGNRGFNPWSLTGEANSR